MRKFHRKENNFISASRVDGDDSQTRYISFHEVLKIKIANNVTK